MRTIYHIAQNYRSAVVWVGDIVGRRQSAHKCKPKTGLSHRKRYEVVAAFLGRNGVAAPPYVKRKTRDPLGWQDHMNAGQGR